MARLAGLMMVVLALAGCGGGPVELEADYPSRPVTVVVPFAPGGASDFIARLLQAKLSADLGQQVVIENRDGGAGNLAMSYAARARPDGYTLYLGNVGTIAINPSLFPDLSVKPAEDFVPVAMLSDVPSLLIARKDFPAADVNQAVAYMRSNPGKVNFASPGTGSLNRLEMELLRKKAGLNVVHVPYKGSATAAMMDVMGGHVDLLFLTATAGVKQAQSGQVKALGVTSAERLPALPNVPTLAEQGHPELVTSSWLGLFAPKGTPQPIVATLRAAALAALQDPEVRRRVGETGGRPPSVTPQQAPAYIAAETRRWATVVRDAGIKAD